MKPLQPIFVGLAAATILLAVGTSAQADKRVALIIGNSAYQNTPTLPNPARDARAIAAMFQKSGYDVVSTAYDLGNLEFKRMIRQFEDAAANADIAVIYYAGHGIEIRGTNYVVPVDAKLASDRDADNEAIPLERLVESVDGAKKLRVIILDACGDNPFMRMGLGPAEPTGINTLIAYAAKARSQAEEGNGEHSPFATALIDNLFMPGLDVRLAFGRVRDQVLKQTSNRQEPFVYGSLGGGNVALVPAPDQPAPATTSDAAGERADYALVAGVGTKGAFRVFLAQHPTGLYADLARGKIAQLEEAQGSVTTAAKTAASRWVEAQRRAPLTHATSGTAAAEAKRQAELAAAKRQAEEAARRRAEQAAALAAAAANQAPQGKAIAGREVALKREEQAHQAAIAALAEKAESRRQVEEALRPHVAEQASSTPAPAPPSSGSHSTMIGVGFGGDSATVTEPHVANEAAASWQTQHETKLPSFPWPPPVASTSYVLPKSLFGSISTVGEETDAIIAALERNGYVERSFYGTPASGVALITRLERINADGSPASGSRRWPTGNYQNDAVNLARFLSGLFYTDPGHYRVIVFVIQDDPFMQASDKKISEEEARRLLLGGANVLPPDIAARPVAQPSHCTALIYEFANDGTGTHMVQSQLTGREHLEKAGLISSLEKTH